MDRAAFTYLLDHPQLITDSQLEGLQALLEQYPYLQSARALLLKGLKQRDSHLYNHQLRKTAAHTSNRHILFEYITSPTFKQDAISQTIKQHDDAIYQIEVVHQDVGEELSKEIDRQLKAEVRKAEAILDPSLFEKKESPSPALDSQENKAQREIRHDEPLEFNKEDTHSFSEWLKLSAARPIERAEKDSVEEGQPAWKKQRKFELIDKFIQQQPKIRPRDIPTTSGNLAQPFTEMPEQVMTETLARVYVAQKNYPKALQAYRILSLKYPEKSGFFADQIRAIEKLLNTKDS